MIVRSKQHHRAASAALSAKRGDCDPKGLRGRARELYDHLTAIELEELTWLAERALRLA